ncbi:MAG: cation transporter [Cyanobacteria bacterium P01_H01_bin.26]
MIKTTDALEARALRLTMLGTLGMALWGLGFALITKSEAILLDGFFSLIGFAIALITQKVFRLVTRPGDEHFPFGYAMFEPILNLSKGLLIALVSLFALVSAISALLTGGRPIGAGVAIVYATIAAVGCFALAGRTRVLAKRAHSPLVAVDVHNWIIDGFISAGVALAFLLIQFTQGTPVAAFAPYADPAIVIVLVAATIMVPFQIIRDAWRQIVGYRPTPDKLQVVNQSVAQTFAPWPSVTWQVRALEIGRFLYVQVYAIDPEEYCGKLSTQDQLRYQIYSALREQFKHLELDVIFTQNLYLNSVYLMSEIHAASDASKCDIGS